MLTITTLSTIIGGLIGIIPSFISYLEKSKQYEYQIEVIKLQSQADAKTLELQAEIAKIQSEAESDTAIHGYDDSGTVGDGFVAALRASVRPVITYSFFFMFALAKFTVAVGLFRSGLNITDISQQIFDDTSMTFFGTIMGFWFGTRGIEIAKGKK